MERERERERMRKKEEKMRDMQMEMRERTKERHSKFSRKCNLCFDSINCILKPIDFLFPLLYNIVKGLCTQRLIDNFN